MSITGRRFYGTKVIRSFLRRSTLHEREYGGRIKYTTSSFSSSSATSYRGYSATTTTSSTVDEAELRKFSALSQHWWRTDTNGPFIALHYMNNVRVPLIRDALLQTSQQHTSLSSSSFSTTTDTSINTSTAIIPPPTLSTKEDNDLPLPVYGTNNNKLSSPVNYSMKPLEGYRILDIGCGGGILSENLARLGAHLTGIDAEKENITVAKYHLALDQELEKRVNYQCITIEELSRQIHGTHGKLFDAVVCSEVIEHVVHMDQFLSSLLSVLRPGGVLMMTTLNRTVESFFSAILGAEYILRMVPAGTHEWMKFLPPDDLIARLQKLDSSVKIERLVGLRYSPFDSKWSYSNDTRINYGLVARKMI